MNLAKFRVCGQILMIDKALLISKSQYFAAMLDGPLQARENEDGSIDLQEEDLETFKQLFFYIKTGSVSKRVMRCEMKQSDLETMAAFYLVDIPQLLITKPILKTFISRSSLYLKVASDAKLFVDEICAPGTTGFALPENSPTATLLLCMRFTKCMKCAYTVNDTRYGGCKIGIVTEHTLDEMETRHPGFSNYYSENKI